MMAKRKEIHIAGTFQSFHPYSPNTRILLSHNYSVGDHQAAAVVEVLPA
jgi:hypothetical protein